MDIRDNESETKESVEKGEPRCAACNLPLSECTEKRQKHQKRVMRDVLDFLDYKEGNEGEQPKSVVFVSISTGENKREDEEREPHKDSIFKGIFGEKKQMDDSTEEKKEQARATAPSPDSGDHKYDDVLFFKKEEKKKAPCAACTVYRDTIRAMQHRIRYSDPGYNSLKVMLEKIPELVDRIQECTFRAHLLV